MKYSSRQYAEALYDVLLHAEGKKYQQALENFLLLLRKNKDYRSLNTILSRYEKIFLKKQGLKKVEVESVSPLSYELREKIEQSIGGVVLLSEKINPKLIGGITILVNDTDFIDGSVKKRITCLIS